jgi:sulfite reductase alpha subunit-like flavoprotein
MAGSSSNTAALPVFLLYGSQTGNAESIAKGLAQDLTEDHGIACECRCLNDAKKERLQDVASCALIICSTTGNGDAPENADAFWRSVKLRSAPKDKFEGVSFAVLGRLILR